MTRDRRTGLDVLSYDECLDLLARSGFSASSYSRSGLRSIWSSVDAHPRTPELPISRRMFCA